MYVRRIIVWILYGMRMEDVWDMYGICNMCRIMHGICMEYVWNMRWISMEYAWNMRGIRIEWNIYRIGNITYLNLKR